jgi:hypothetical protein
MKYEYEIAKMLTLSTAHISEETANKLNVKIIYGMNYIPLPIYNKDGYGWFIFVSEDYNELNLPDDLKKCLDLATENECEWLCLDCDGLIVPNLPTYDW